MKTQFAKNLWYLLERIGLARRQIGLGDLPTEGRVSVPSWHTFDSRITQMVTNYITPAIPFELTEALERAAVYNPNISQAVKNWTNMANTGHQLVIEGPDARVERAADILNEMAYRIYKASAGVDGLINHYLDQVAISGAVSSEDVVDLGRREISEVVLVPPSKIRFKEDETGRLVAYQKTTSIDHAQDLVKLNENTWAMYSLQVYRDSPYPKPPMSAVLEPLIVQRKSWENIEFILTKLGLLGLVRIGLNIPTRKPSEDENQYETRKAQFLTKALDAFAPNFRKGLIVGYKDFDIEHHNVTGDARGARELIQTLEEWFFSGLGTTAGMHGRNYTTTETFAGVMYKILVRDSENSQRLVKRRYERTCRLELRLKGIEVDSISAKFDPSPHLNPYPQALAESTRVRAAILKAERGVADPDQLAQEMGYDSWFDQSKIEIGNLGTFGFKKNLGTIGYQKRSESFIRRFRFDKARNQYRYIGPSIWIYETKKDEEAAKQMEKALAEYKKKIQPHMNQAREKAIDKAIEKIRSSTPENFADAEAFAAEILRDLRYEYQAVMTGAEVKKTVSDVVAESYTAFKLSDMAWDVKPPVTFGIGNWDLRTIKFMGKVDQFFFSKYIDNTGMKGPIDKFLQEQFLEKGESLFSRTEPEILDQFRALFEDKLEDLADYQVKNIINHSVQRQRNWSAGAQMREAEVEYAEVVAVMDDRTSKICKRMNSKLIPVGVAMDALDGVLELSPEEYLEHLKAIKPDEYFLEKEPEQIAADGRGFPPYHAGGCRTRVRAVIE